MKYLEFLKEVSNSKVNIFGEISNSKVKRRAYEYFIEISNSTKEEKDGEYFNEISNSWNEYFNEVSNSKMIWRGRKRWWIF